MNLYGRILHFVHLLISSVIFDLAANRVQKVESNEPWQVMDFSRRCVSNQDETLAKISVIHHSCKLMVETLMRLSE